MFDAVGVMKAVVAVILVIAFIALCCGLLTSVVRPFLAGVEAESNVHAGEIVDKKIINACSGLFSSSNMDYRLVIKVEYELNGVLKETEKSISVDKETYRQADVGDWFDAHTLEVIPSVAVN